MLASDDIPLPAGTVGIPNDGVSLQCTTMAFGTAPLSPSRMSVKDHTIAYHDSGTGNPVVFLHGTSSYLWRNVVPHLSKSTRCVAPDLLGHGESAKLSDSGPSSYRFVDHQSVLDDLLDQLDLGNEVVLVGHDWGSALAFDWARRHENRVAGIAFMEAIVRPMIWSERPAGSRDIFVSLRSPAGEQMILEDNVLVEGLPEAIVRDLTAAEHNSYRRPFARPGEDRRPTLTWGRHFLSEDSPVEIAKAIIEWLPI